MRNTWQTQDENLRYAQILTFRAKMVKKNNPMKLFHKVISLQQSGVFAMLCGGFDHLFI